MAHALHYPALHSLYRYYYTLGKLYGVIIDCVISKVELFFKPWHKAMRLMKRKGL